MPNSAIMKRIRMPVLSKNRLDRGRINFRARDRRFRAGTANALQCPEAGAMRNDKDWDCWM